MSSRIGCNRVIVSYWLIGVLAICGFSRATIAAVPFAVGVIDSPGDVGKYSSLAIDGRQVPSVAYYDQTSGNLKYATRPIREWIVETVDATGDVGFDPSLSLDQAGNPHISYYDNTNGDLKYATKAAGVWTIETIDAAGDVGANSSIALDGNGNVHVAYSDLTNPKLKYAKKSGGTWALSTVDAGPSVGGFPSLGLDASANPHIAYYDFGNADLKYARKVLGTWVTETLDGGGIVGSYPALVLDDSGTPHICYRDETNDDLKYAYKNNNGVWSFERVATTGAGSGYSSLVLSTLGDVSVAYYEATNGTIRYAVRVYADGIGWLWPWQTVDATAVVGKYCSLRLDAEGSAHVTYYDATNADLKYASTAVLLKSPLGGERWAPGSEVVVTWDGGGILEIGLSLDGGFSYQTLRESVSGGAATITVPTVQTDEARIRLVRSEPYSSSVSPGLLSIGSSGGGQAGGQFYSMSVNTAAGSGAQSSLCIDVNGVAHALYWNEMSGELRYAEKKRGKWTDELVTTLAPGSYPASPSLAVDLLGRPHIAYCDAANTELNYAVRVAGVWNAEVVVAETAKSLSLALDVNGDPHIAYRAELTGFVGSLYYMHRESVGTWTSEWLGGTLANGSICLKLDNDGVPTVVFDNMDASWKYFVAYKRRSSSGWPSSASTLAYDIAGNADPSIGANARPSLAIDSRGRLHVSYYAAADSNLWYATHYNGTQWLDIVDGDQSSHDLGRFSSIALDASGGVRITYLDATTGTVKYAVGELGLWANQNVSINVDNEGASSTCLALDAHGNPHVLYGAGDGDRLEYASGAVELTAPVGGELWIPGTQEIVTWDGVGVVDVLVSLDGGASYTALLSSVGGGQVSVTVPTTMTEFARVQVVRNKPYSTSTSPEYVTIGPEERIEWWSEAVNPSGGGGWYTSLAVDDQVMPHIAYFDNGSGSIKYARREGGKDWIIETVDVGDVGWYAALAVGPDGVPHASYYDSFNGDLKYAVRTNGVWNTEVVDAGGDVGRYTAIAVDNLGRPHICYHDVTNGNLKYAMKDGASWLIETADNNGVNVGWNPSLTLDGQGSVHVSYYKPSNGSLLYAVRDDNGWTSETISNGGQYNGLALDDGSVPHVAYVLGGDLKYARRVGAAWESETVDVEGSINSCDMAFSANGDPCIAYRNSFILNLKYAEKRRGEWTIQKLDSQVSSGGYVSLAFDGKGNPHVSHYGYSDSRVRYTTSALGINSPQGGDVWPVGARRAVTWSGVGTVDVSISLDGGASYTTLAEDVKGGAASILVPHTPSRFCRVRIERKRADNTYLDYYYPESIAHSDSLFTIETSIALLNLLVTAPEEGRGLVVSWETDPGPEDLKGYRLERRRRGDPWMTVAERIVETSYHDASGLAGDEYRIYASNGLGEEFYLGESSGGKAPPIDGRLVAYPVPFRGGELKIRFGVASVAGAAQAAEVVIYDVAGRRVRSVAKIAKPEGTLVNLTWDGRDDRGRTVASGIYFLRVTSGQVHQTRKLVIVR